MEKKKKMLFVTYTMHCGGAEKALLNLFSSIDPEKYDIDLQLFHNKGYFLEMLPAHIHVLPEIYPYNLMIMPISHFFLPPYSTMRCKVLWVRVRNALYMLFKKTKTLPKNQRRQLIAASLAGKHPVPQQQYDIAVGYLQGQSIYYIVDKVNAKRKLGWVHQDYIGAQYSADIDRPYFTKLDGIVTVSDLCRDSLLKAFPELKDKIHTVLNICSKEVIHEMADEYIPSEYSDDGNTKILTIGRLTHTKGYDLAIDACEVLRENGVPFKWYVLGAGDLLDELKQYAIQKGVEDCIVFLGTRSNPYPYIRQADLYVQPSRYEGCSVAMHEARLLQIPLVVTNFTVAKDQITDHKNGLICEMDGQSIAGAVTEMIENKMLYNQIKAALLNTKDTKAEVSKHYMLFDGTE